ncbi:MAG: hypothetical protein ACXWN1_13580 [Thermoanaerobaculia bacterium]
MLQPRELLTANMTVVDRVVAVVCHRARLFGADAEDFASSVKLALIEDDYAILRKYEGRSSLATYLSVVIRRLLADERMRTRGRWHPSTEAVRSGPAAVLLETLVLRDDHTLDEALPLARDSDPTLTREEAEAILDRLPQRVERPTVVSFDATDAGESFAGRESADTRALQADARRLAQHAGRVIRDCQARFTLEDRMILRMRFASAMSIADISRILRLPQRPLYRRIEGLLDALRTALVADGLDGGTLEELVGSSALDDALDFGLDDGKREPVRQSIRSEESR